MFKNETVRDKLAEIGRNILEIEGDIDAAWRSASTIFVGATYSVQEISEIYGGMCDKLIVAARINEKLSYIGGKLKISSIDELSFQVTGEFFFKNVADKWIVKKTSSGVLQKTKRLSKEAIAELHQQKEILFEIDEPA